MKKPDWTAWVEDKKECLKWNRLYLKKGMLRRGSLKPRNYLKKSLHNLDFANWIYDKHKYEIKDFFEGESFFDWVIVIYYYAVYHGALALLASKNLSSKSHMATLNALILNFYHENEIEKKDVEVVADSISKSLEKEDIKIFAGSKDLRERVSYGAGYNFEESLVKSSKKDVISFIEKVRSILEL